MAQMTKRPSLTLPPVPEKMTYEEFLCWNPEYQHAEWIDGKVELLHAYWNPVSKEWEIMVSEEHDDLTGFLLTLLRSFVRVLHLGRVCHEPFNMKTGPHLPGRSPDVLFVSNANLSRIDRNHLEGPADLVIEVVSQESIRRDKVTKLEEYEQGGVKEYWIIDPLQEESLFYQLNESGKYETIATNEKGEYHSRELPGLWVRPDWFRQNALPSELDILKEWKLI